MCCPPVNQYSGSCISDLMDKAGVEAAKPVTDQLTYASYAHNRKIAPEVSPERWARIFPDAAEMEIRYQKELEDRERGFTDFQLKCFLHGSESVQG